ncbi:hypothetical protein [Jhaorihella thermophila]|uniref:hypothetical protein n=1 Tax=Jhaorihella thermophila TaxID=488547 RepID=UPI0011B097D2|nr:hypothetical protein [Jhaorihella thermophila]
MAFVALSGKFAPWKAGFPTGIFANFAATIARWLFAQVSAVQVVGIDLPIALSTSIASSAISRFNCSSEKCTARRLSVLSSSFGGQIVTLPFGCQTTAHPRNLTSESCTSKNAQATPFSFCGPACRL